jgi:hypothetical protein
MNKPIIIIIIIVVVVFVVVVIIAIAISTRCDSKPNTDVLLLPSQIFLLCILILVQNYQHHIC